ncbi:MAG: B12-binding domain-containing radical SAM protein [Candidatus Omnitrophica bacterium]|nr:B12-binding domain-containing radical SAM protein [Candidatus Omnitrophota bacterium]
MHIAFICFGFENIGVEYVSACLKERGHRTSLVFDPALFDTYVLKSGVLGKMFDSRARIVERVLASKPDLVAFSVMTDNYQRACSMAEQIKSKDASLPVIFGGVHPTSVPEMVIKQPYVDYLCVGEGEEAIPELCDALAGGSDTSGIRNIWSKKDGRIFANAPRPMSEDLDALPFPDKELFYSELPVLKRGVYRINVGRGCHLRCSFCTNSLMRDIYGHAGYKKRKRSVRNVMQELKQAKAKYDFRHVLIIDDWFTDDVVWLEEFADLFKQEIGVSFACDVFPGKCDQKVVALLQRAGCTVASIGIQTYSEKLRRDVLHRQDSNDDIVEAMALFQKTKIFVYADFILGIPGQDQEELLNIAHFVNKVRADFVFFLWLRYYPGTPITQMAVTNAWITSEQLDEINAGKNTGSYFDRSLTYKKEAAKLASFLSLAPLLPRGVVSAMIDRKMYRIFPSSSLFYFRFMSIIVPFMKRLWSGKKGTFYFTVQENCWFHLYYALQTLKANFRN